MTLSWCVVHDSGWMDNGCFAAEVAEHGDPTDCQMVEMELHPAGTRVVTAEALVIERDKDTGGWPESVLHQISRMTDVTRIGAGLFLDDLADALARSKEGP